MTVNHASKQPASYVPFLWKETSIDSGQTGVEMGVSGIVGITRFALAKQASVVSLTIQLSAALAAGFIDFEITKGGTPTGKTIRMNVAAGTVKRGNFVPGDLVGGPGERLGLQWTSNAALLPSGSINALGFFEVQNV